MIKKKILILDDNETLLYSLKVNISKFDVITASTLPEAMKKLQDNEISFIVADIKLKKGKNGQEIFNKLFKTGKSIPGIVFSAYALTEKVIADLANYGIIGIIEKGGSSTKLYQRIQTDVEKLLKDPKKRFFAVHQKLRDLGLLQRKISCGKVKTTIEKKLKKIYNRKYTINEENKIKDKMVQICNIDLIPEGSRPHRFRQLGI